MEFETLIEDHRDRLYRYCLSLCRCAEDAADSAQDAIAIALRDRAQYDPRRGAFSTWLFAIARHRWQRILSERGLLPVSLEGAPGVRASERDLARLLERMDLEAALDQLTEKQREAILLIRVDGLPYREAARLLGIPVPT